MKTWKKIEDTRKRTNEIVSLKNRNEDRIRQVSLLIHNIPLYRKKKSFKRNKRWNATNLLKIIWSKNKELKKNAKYNRQSTFPKPKRQNKLKSSDLRMSNRFAIMSSKLKQKTRWRTKLLTSRNASHKWRWKRNNVVRFLWLSVIKLNAQLWKKLWDRQKKRKSWIWKGSRWNLSRNSKTLKLSRKKHTKS